MHNLKLRLLLSRLFIFSLFISFQGIASENQWQLIKDEEGVQIYTLQTEFTDIIKAKCITEINSDLLTVKAFIDNAANRPEWIPYLKTSHIVEHISDKKRIEFSLFEAPWPASDREFLYQLEQLSYSDDKLVYKMQSTEIDIMPENDNAIRADLFESVYTLSNMQNGHVRVELVFHADPKGWLPNWIVNIIQRVLPYKMLKNMRQKLSDSSDIES